MEALPCFHRDFRQQVVQDHQVSVLPAAGFLIDGDVGQVVHVFFFRRFRDEYIPGGFLQRFCFRQGTEGSGLFLCFFQGVIYAEDTADQGGDSQQEKDLPVVLQEKEGDRLAVFDLKSRIPVAITDGDLEIDFREIMEELSYLQQ